MRLLLAVALAIVCCLEPLQARELTAVDYGYGYVKLCEVDVKKYPGQNCKYGECKCPDGYVLKSDGKCYKVTNPTCKSECNCPKDWVKTDSQCKITKPASCYDECTCSPPSYKSGDYCEWKEKPDCKYNCECPKGYTLKDGKCYEYKKCEKYDYGKCKCPYGYQVSPDGQSCYQVKDCEKKPQCSCKAGYSLSGEWCIMKKPCEKKPVCKCEDGYKLEGKQCVLVKPCDKKEICNICPGGYQYEDKDKKCYGEPKDCPKPCDCPPNYTKEGDKCYQKCDGGYKDEGIKEGYRYCVGQCPKGWTGYCNNSGKYYCYKDGSCPKDYKAYVQKCGY